MFAGMELFIWILGSTLIVIIGYILKTLKSS